MREAGYKSTPIVKEGRREREAGKGRRKAGPWCTWGRDGWARARGTDWGSEELWGRPAGAGPTLTWSSLVLRLHRRKIQDCALRLILGDWTALEEKKNSCHPPDCELGAAGRMQRALPLAGKGRRTSQRPGASLSCLAAELQLHISTKRGHQNCVFRCHITIPRRDWKEILVRAPENCPPDKELKWSTRRWPARSGLATEKPLALPSTGAGAKDSLPSVARDWG